MQGRLADAAKMGARFYLFYRGWSLEVQRCVQKGVVMLLNGGRVKVRGHAEGCGVCRNAVDVINWWEGEG